MTDKTIASTPAGSLTIKTRLLCTLPACCLLSALGQTNRYQPTVCVEYLTNPAATSYLAHFGYVHPAPVIASGSSVDVLPYNGANNFFDPLDSPGAPSLFYPGDHPEAVVVSVSYNTEETWYLGTSTATATPASFGGTKKISPTCAATIRPATLSFTAPGLYTHQFLGQVDGGPAADSLSNFSVVALAGGRNIAVDNLSYTPNDTANPTRSLNPNSIYGDVTVAYGAPTRSGVRLLLMQDGRTITAGIATLGYAGPAVPPPSTIGFVIADRTFGDAPFQVSATSNSSGAISYGLVSGPAQVSGSTVILTGAGNVIVQAAQSEVSGKFSATKQNASFNIAKAKATVALDGLSLPYTGQPVTPNVTTVPSGLDVALTYDGSATAPVVAGTYKVQATVLSANYQGTASGNLVITRPVSGTVLLTTRSTLARNASGYRATIVVTNSGTGTAQHVVLAAAALGTANSILVPLSLGNLAPANGTVTTTLDFSSSAGTTGQTVLQKLALTFTGGTASVSARATLP